MLPAADGRSVIRGFRQARGAARQREDPGRLKKLKRAVQAVALPAAVASGTSTRRPLLTS